MCCMVSTVLVPRCLCVFSASSQQAKVCEAVRGSAVFSQRRMTEITENGWMDGLKKEKKNVTELKTLHKSANALRLFLSITPLACIHF